MISRCSPRAHHSCSGIWSRPRAPARLQCMTEERQRGRLHGCDLADSCRPCSSQPKVTIQTWSLVLSVRSVRALDACHLSSPLRDLHPRVPRCNQHEPDRSAVGASGTGGLQFNRSPQSVCGRNGCRSVVVHRVILAWVIPCCHGALRRYGWRRFSMMNGSFKTEEGQGLRQQRFGMDLWPITCVTGAYLID